MKGIIIFEDANPTLKNVYCIDVANSDITMDTKGTYTLTGKRVFMKTASCNKSDTYDFETGALIALMKLCGLEKSAKAYAEIFDDTAYGDALIERDELKNKLQETTDCLNDLSKSYDGIVRYCDTLREGNKGLQEEIKRLKGESENRWKIYQRNVQKKLDRINELERAYKASNDDKAKLVEYYQREIKKLEEENKELKGNIDELFESEQHSKSELGRLYFEKHRLEEEIENLKLDCEKLQHGYNDMIFCGGRRNGKQYTLLPRTLDINGTVYRKSIQIKDFGEQINKLTVDSLIEENRAFTRKCVDEWLYRIPTKREEMWEKIFELHKESDVIIKVKREDINTFLHELENKIPEITWASGVKIFETKYTIKDIFKELKTCDAIYFRLWKVNKLSYSNDQFIYPLYEFKHIDYLPPMRWDLFKKGRLVVKVDSNNYEDFYSNCETEIGRKPLKACEGTFTVYYKKGTFHIRPYSDIIHFAKKIVNWEDVK